MIRGIELAALLLSSVSVALLPGAVWADGMKFSIFWPCSGNASFCAPRVLGEGTIERDTPRKFELFLRSKEQREHTLPPSPEISLNSGGGDVVGAMQFGRLIRRLGLSTRLSPEYSRVIPHSGGETEVFIRNPVCASACSLAFIGGVNRFFDGDVKIGVHQFSGANGELGDGATQVTLVGLAAYVEEMGVSRNLLDIASLIPPSQIYWLSPSELTKLRVDNMTVAQGQWRLEALDGGTLVAFISQVKPGPQSTVSLTVLKRQGEPTLVVAFTPSKVFGGSASDAFGAVNGKSVSLEIDGQELAAYRGTSWTIGSGSVSAVLLLPEKVLQRLRSGQILSVRVDVARSVGQFDPSLSFPLAGLDRYLSPIMK